MPRKIRALLKDYRKAGATVDIRRGKGSHRIISHPSYKGSITLAGAENQDAKHYQEKELREFLDEIDD